MIMADEPQLLKNEIKFRPRLQVLETDTLDLAIFVMVAGTYALRPSLVLLALKSDRSYRCHSDFEASWSLLQSLLPRQTLRRFVPVGLSLRVQIMQTHEADAVVAMTGTLAEGLPVWFLRHGAVLVQVGQYVLSADNAASLVHIFFGFRSNSDLLKLRRRCRGYMGCNRTAFWDWPSWAITIQAITT